MRNALSVDIMQIPCQGKRDPRINQNQLFRQHRNMGLAVLKVFRQAADES
jgi:hypothetical protein